MLMLLKIYLDRYYHHKYGNIWKEVPIGKELQILLETTAKYFNEYPDKTKVSEDELALYFFATQNVKDKDKQLYLGVLNECKSITEPGDVQGILDTIKRRAIAGELALVAFGVAEGRKELSDLSQCYERLNLVSTTETPQDPFVTDELEELYEQTIASTGLRWRSKTLNRMLGSLRKGDFGFIFARPESGKTTFLASEVSYFGTQTTRPILWFNNEEQGNKVKIRLYQAALGKELHELMSDRAANRTAYMEATGGNIRLFDSASIHKRQVEELCNSLEPSLVIFDQIDKLKGFADDRDDLRLGSIYIWAREIAKQYAPVIGVCQAGGTGEGKKWLTMDDIVNAKTSKQAEADWILGIGKSHDVDFEYIRHLQLCKNKLQGDSDTDPSLRHGRADIRIRPEIARYEDILK